MPAPFPEALKPAISGIRNAAEKTGPMNPTDCATTSTNETFLPPSRSYPDDSCDPSTLIPLPAPALPGRPPSVRPFEPHVHLTGADGGLVLRESDTWRHAAAATEGRGHHQIVTEVALGVGLAVLRHVVDHARVIAPLHHVEDLHVGLVVLHVVDVVRSSLALA